MNGSGLVDRLEQALLSAKTQPAPRSVRRARSGKLDWRSAMRAERNPDDPRLFRRTRREPRGPEPLRVVVNVDLSFSMGPSAHRAISSALALAEAVDRTGSRSAIVAFDSTARIVKRWGPGRSESLIPSSHPFTDLPAALDLDSRLFGEPGEGKPVVVNVTDDDFGADRSYPRRWFASFREAGGCSLALVHQSAAALVLRTRGTGEDVVVRVARDEDLVPGVERFLSWIEGNVHV